MDELKHLQTIAQHTPFLAMVAGGPKPSGQLVTRLLEAAIIGGVVMFGTVQTLQHDMDSLKSSIQEVKEDVDEMRRDFYQPRLP